MDDGYDEPFTINMHLHPDNRDDPAEVELTKGRWATMVEGLCYAISNSNMDNDMRLEWSVVLNGVVDQAGLRCPHEH